MTQRDWIEKDFYRELGVASSASNDEIKKAYRKLARELHPDANPGDAKAEARFKTVSEAYGVLSDEKKRKEYDETRALFAGGGGGFPGGFGTGAGGQGFDIGDLFSRTQAGGGGGLGDLFGGIFGGRAGTAAPPRNQRGADVESELTIEFVDAVRGAEVPIRLTSPGRCERCGGTGAKPGQHASAVPDVQRRRASSAAARARSRSPSRASTAAAPGGSSTTRAPNAAATASRRGSVRSPSGFRPGWPTGRRCG